MSDGGCSEQPAGRAAPRANRHAGLTEVASPNAYNSLGVGTTQLSNNSIVYNHMRHGEYCLRGRKGPLEMQLRRAVSSGCAVPFTVAPRAFSCAGRVEIL
jgi:hypothetical protein